MKKLLRLKTMLLLCALIAGSGSTWAAEDDVHDMSKVQETGLNNNAEIPSIEFSDPGYTIKEVQVGWKYNKTTANVVTIEVTIGGTSLGTQKVGTKTSSVATFISETSLSGDVVISFTNHAGSGTGKGTFYVQSVKFVEGAAVISDSPLASISVAGSHKTMFYQGESFTHEGAVVTATYEDESTKNVTSNATFSIPDMSTVGTKRVDVSYSEKEVTKSTSYNIEVVEYTQPLEVEIDIEQSMFKGITFNSSSQTTEKTISATVSRVVMSIEKGNSNTYVKDGEMRCYANGSLTFEAPSNYVLTAITFTKGSSWGMKDASTGTLKNQAWTANENASEVTFGFSGRTDITKIVVTLAPSATVTLAAACTDGSKYYGTYSNAKAFVVPADLTVSTVEVTDGVLAVTDYSTGDVVKAGTGVMVSSTTAGEHTVLLSEETGEELDGNMLKASSVDMTGSNKFYRLTMHNGDTIGFWWGAENGAAFTIAANKAYLAVPETLAREGFAFDFGDATNIRSIGNEQLNNDNVYNLAGQRVAQPTKGLYIVNGKKIVIR